LNNVTQILADLNVLELIEPSAKIHKVDDANEYWTITEYGKEIYKIIRKEILEKNLPMDNTSNELEN
jgi:hypothetical protein